MNAQMVAEFQNNKFKIFLFFPIELMDIDETNYFKYSGMKIFETDNLNINISELDKQIENVKNFINDTFKIENININSNISIEDYEQENSNLIYNFIKANKHLNILLRCKNFQSLIESLGNNEYKNLKIKFQNSSEEISYEEFYQMYLSLYEIIDFVKHYNLSPLEQVMLVYDIVKSNEYNSENKGQDSSISRDLNKIIKSDKIVCVGFVNLIDFILTNLNFKTDFIRVADTVTNSTHRRNYIYLNDPKYNINGMFFLDATWDSKRNDKYLENYRYFLKPLRFFYAINKNEYVIFPQSFQHLQKNKEELLSYLENIDDEELTRFNFTLINLIKKCNNENPNKIIYSKEELKELIDKMYILYNSKIPEDAFKNALYKVRKIEFLNKIISFLPNEEYIDSIVNKYYKKDKELLLLKIFGIYEEPTLLKSLKESKANSVEEDLLRIELLKAFKEKLNDFPNNDYIKKM